MNRLSHSISLIILLLLAQSASGQSPILVKFIDAYVIAHHFNGTILIQKHSRISYARSFGLANRQLREDEEFLPPQNIPTYKNAVALTGLVGAGNIQPTTSDLLRWQESLKTAKILKRESIKAMESPQVKANVDNSDAYGYGLSIKSIYNDTKIFHNGGTLGYWNSLQHFKNADRTIIVFSNNESEKGGKRHCRNFVWPENRFALCTQRDPDDAGTVG